MPKFTKETILAEIMKIPGAQEVLAKYNLPCLSCPFAKFETEKLKIGQVCQMYGIDVDNLIKDLSKLNSKK